MKQMLIITGPQGSGNHVFSKCFALHEDVFGWQSLVDQVWEGHHHEPFADCWHNPELLHDFDWDQSEYFVTSVSTPYVKNKVEHTPDYVAFAYHASKFCKVQYAVIGRDKTILKNQQERVRGKATLETALDSLHPVHYNTQYLSQELLMLYKENYLKGLANNLKIPIAYWHPELNNILAEDANEKYINKVDSHWLDDYVFKAIKES